MILPHKSGISKKSNVLQRLLPLQRSICCNAKVQTLSEISMYVPGSPAQASQSSWVRWRGRGLRAASHQPLLAGPASGRRSDRQPNCNQDEIKPRQEPTLLADCQCLPFKGYGPLPEPLAAHLLCSLFLRNCGDGRPAHATGRVVNPISHLFPWLHSLMSYTTFRVQSELV